MDRFWEQRPLEALTPAQWEALCDGCAHCCRHKFEDIDSGRLFFTQVVCRHLDLESCRCTCYSERHRRVPDCIRLTPENVRDITWLPEHCAYRLLREGRPLPDWHPLLCGDPNRLHELGFSVRGQVISEDFVDLDDLEAQVLAAAGATLGDETSDP